MIPQVQFHEHQCLITSAIRPITSAAGTHEDRLRQTLDSLGSLYEFDMFTKIWIIDGTGFDLREAIKSRGFRKHWIEVDHFQQDADAVRQFGYGYGETEIYQRFLKISGFRSGSITKLSGRYNVRNLPVIMSRFAKYREVYFTYYPRWLEWRRYIHTAMFKTRIDRLEEYVRKSRDYLAGKNRAPLEEAMYNAVQSITTDRLEWISVPQPQYEGIAGSTGRKLTQRSFPYSVLHNLEKFPCMALAR